MKESTYGEQKITLITTKTEIRECVLRAGECGLLNTEPQTYTNVLNLSQECLMAQVLYMRTELAHREVKQNMCAAVSQGKKRRKMLVTLAQVLIPNLPVRSAAPS